MVFLLSSIEPEFPAIGRGRGRGRNRTRGSVGGRTTAVSEQDPPKRRRRPPNVTASNNAAVATIRPLPDGKHTIFELV